jgi:hypothetical protein
VTVRPPGRPAGERTGEQTGVDRRGFLLLAGGATGAAALLGACGGSSSARPPDVKPVITSPNHLEGDLSVAALLASMENLLVSVYQEGIDKKDKFGTFPPGVMAVVTAAQQQHKDHAVAWNGILTGAGKPGVTGVDLSVKSAAVDAPLARARDYSSLLSLCHDLGTVTASTYQAAIGALQNVAALKVAASIHTVEHEHVAVLNFLLGRNPPPDSFSHVDGARTTTDNIG